MPLSPRDFAFVLPPGPASYQQPQTDFSWLGNLPQDYRQGQQYARERQLQTMFQTPQGQELLARSGIDPNSLTGSLIRATGAQAAGPIANQLFGAQLWGPMLGRPPSDEEIINGPQSNAGPPSQTGNKADPRGMIPTLRDAAIQNGINPNRFVALARGEGLFDFHGDYENGKPTSFGALQLHKGGRTKGLGDEYFAETGKDPADPRNEVDAIQWAARKVRQTGWTPWSAARKMGWGRWDGIGEQPAAQGRSDQLNPTDRAALNKMYGEGGTSTAQQAPNEELPTSGPPFAPTQQAAASNNSVTGPEGIRLASNAPGIPGQPASTVTPTSPAELQGGAGSGITGGPPNQAPVTPGGNAALGQRPSALTTAALPPAAAQAAAGAPSAPRPAAPPPPQQIAQVGPPQAPGQAALDERRYRPEVADRYGAVTKDYRQRAAIAGAMGKKELAAQFDGLAKYYEGKENEIRKVLEERAKEQFGVGIAEQKKQAETDVEQYSNLHKGLAGAAMTAANSLQYSQQALELVNNPQFYSGSGEQANLGIKRFLAGIGIDPGAAAPQEVFRKVMAANINQQINALRAESEAMGEKGGRIFAPMITQMEKAAQNPDNSIAANRYLTVFAIRNAQRTMAIASMADDYKQQHGRLDAGFEKQLRNWIAANPVLTKDEMKNPGAVGAQKYQEQAPQGGTPIPTRPSTLPPGSQYSPSRNQWRTPNGQIFDAAGRPMGA